MATEIEHCPKCDARWPSPAAIPVGARRQIAELARVGKRLDATRRIREFETLSLRDAKAITVHISRERGICHHHA